MKTTFRKRVPLAVPGLQLKTDKSTEVMSGSEDIRIEDLRIESREPSSSKENSVEHANLQSLRLVR